jgi:protein-L-isoaspartate(D-aspartate) O-methyltransferase
MPLDAILLPTIAQRRDFMINSIRRQLESRHSTLDLREVDRVLWVMRGIEREKFLAPRQKSAAYLPIPLDIGFCQTISDAYIVALMTSAVHVEAGDNVLDVGTGSGYQAAILSRLAAHVQSVEIIPQLAVEARKRLKHLGYRNIDVAAADGYAGWPQRAPYDVIVVAAGATAIPQPLLDQLKPGGRLIMPVGPTTLEEELVLATKTQAGSVTRCTLGLEAFVPMTGQARKIAQRSRRSSPTSTVLPELPQCFAAPVT